MSETGNLDRLLDRTLLEGARAYDRYLGPFRGASLVRSGDVGDGQAIIEHLCQLWGGACDLILPLGDEKRIPEPWTSFLADAEIGVLDPRHILPEDQHELDGFELWRWSEGEPLLSILAGVGRMWERAVSVRVPVFIPENEWNIAYLGTLGSWPERPNERLVAAGGLREDIEFADIIPTARVSVENPSALDLLERLRDVGGPSPALASHFYLGRPQLPRATDIPQPPIVPNPWQEAEEHGPNIVVVYEPGSVDDLCLLWNLRAAHGLPRGFPLAVPSTENVPEALATWVTPDHIAFTAWGLRDTRCALVSLSVDPERLALFGAEAAGLFREHPEVQARNYIGPVWSVLDASAVLRSPPPPARRTSDVANFTAGRALVPAWHPNDHDVVAARPPAAWQPRTHVRIEVRERLLPQSRTLRRRHRERLARVGSPTRWLTQGGFGGEARDPGGLLEIIWPSGWEVLAATIEDHGLRAEPSDPGKAASALLRRLGSIDYLNPLLSRHILDEIVRLTWFRRRMRDLSRAMEQGNTETERRLQTIEEHLTAAALNAVEEVQPSLTFDRLRQKVLGGNAGTAEAWLSWAESRGILVRGATVKCATCGAQSWRTVAEFGPTIVCPG